MAARDDPLVQALLFDVQTKCRTVSGRSAALSRADFASTIPQEVAALTGRIADELESVATRVAAFPLAADERSNYLAFIGDFADELGANLRYIDSAGTLKVPWSLVQPLEALLKKQYGNRTLLLRPKWTFNYSIAIEDLRGHYERQLLRVFGKDGSGRSKVSEVLGPFPGGVHIISFPSLARLNAPLHLGLLHEIGHLAAERVLERERDQHTQLFSINIAKDVAADLSVAPLWRLDKIAQRLEIAQRLRRRFLEELLSDHFAILTGGAAALFAIASFGLAQGLDGDPLRSPASYYPPWRLRLRTLLVRYS